MNNSDSTKIFISLKLIPQRRDGTFFPFVHFQEACYIFLQKLYPLFQNSKNPEDIHPLLGEILLILSADTQKDYLHALDLFSSCRQILKLCNEICRQADWNFSLDLAIAADAGRAEKLIIPGSGPFPDAVAWTGIHEERASRISHAMEKGVHKDTLIT
ncbi:MAG: hypothetical protein HXL71_06550, partial [Dialister invisus]|nr:hypothetical protein [Dialister invisus]